jgi:hypothetical protein
MKETYETKENDLTSLAASGKYLVGEYLISSGRREVG